MFYRTSAGGWHWVAATAQEVFEKLVKGEELTHQGRVF
jgi:hypothetical protein